MIDNATANKLKKNIVPTLSIKERMMYLLFKKVYKQIQTPNSVFTKEWLKNVIKITQSELYKLFPDKTFGQLSYNCFDDDFKNTNDYGENIYYVDISFHDRYTKIPWLICRFYRKNAKVRFYVTT
jgi:hypothetical protein